MAPPPSTIDLDVDPALLPHNDAGPQVNAVTWTLFVIASVFLSLRLYCKFLGRRGIWWDDWILIMSWVAHLISCAIMSSMVAGGYGKHPWDKAQPTSTDILISMVRTTFTVTAAAWSKTAFALTLLRISEGWLRWVVWFIIASMNIALGLNAMIGWVNCRPVQASWDRDVDGSCMHVSVIIIIGYVSGAYSAACDFILALLPWTVIWKLQMKPKEKLGVGIAMSMGVVAGIVASVKTAKLDSLSSGDSFDAAELSIWDTAEISVTIMAASIPALRVLLRDARTSARHYYGNQSSGNEFNHVENREHHSAVVKSKRLSERREDGSDDGILDSPAAVIYRVDEVHIEYESAADVNSYEMRNRT